MSSYVEKCPKPIPIGLQEYAYQCEGVSFETGSCTIHGFIPRNGGKEPYPNEEKDKVDHYEMRLERFTGNSIQLTFTKKFKDKSEQIFTTSTSFAAFVNALFTGDPANIFYHEPPVNQFKTS